VGLIRVAQRGYEIIKVNEHKQLYELCMWVRACVLRYKVKITNILQLQVKYEDI